MCDSAVHARAVLIAVLTLLSAGGLAATRAQGPAKGQPKQEDSRLLLIRSDLGALFRYWNDDRDNYVDASELAQGFRGENAKPYRPAPAPKPDGDKTKSAESKENDKTKPPAPQRGTPKLTLREIKKQYPDYDFLLHWDKDRDDRISAEEFNAFTELVVAHFAAFFRKQDEDERLKRELDKDGIKAAERQRLLERRLVLNTQLGMLRDGFKHQLFLDKMAHSMKQQQQRRIEWHWWGSYKTYHLHKTQQPRR